MHTLNVITNLEQLEGRTIKLVEHSYGTPHTILILTEDRAVAHLTFDAHQSYDQPYVDYNLVTDEVEIYEWFAEELIEYEIIDEDDVQELQNEIERRDKEYVNEHFENQKKLRYEEYLKLKKEFEVEYKL